MHSPSLLALLDNLFDKARRRFRNDLCLALFLLSPALLLLGVFGIGPLFFSVYLSLFGGKFGMGPWVGLSNYRELLHSPDFWNSLRITLYYAAATIPLSMMLSFILAWMLFRIARARGLFRTVFFLPYITSAVAAAMVWRAILNPKFGPANAILAAIGLPAQTWLLEPRGLLHIITDGAIPPGIGPSLALCCVIAFDIWHISGFMIVVMLAGMTAIPNELLDAARIDGAGPIQILRRIVVPLLAPTLFFLAIVSGIRSFQAFNSFYALTGNGSGPLDTTRNLTVYIYANFYEYQRWGYGAATATLLCLAIILLTILQWRFVGRRVHYQ